MQRVKKSFPAIALLIVFAIVLLSAFSAKAFHMDDILSLYSAKNILRTFTRPYDFTINWSGTIEHFWNSNKNPPLGAYILAFLIKIFSEREVPLHIAYIFFPVISIAALYSLARKFTKNAILPSLFLFISPAFFVSSTNLMCDIPQIAFYLSALSSYIKGSDNNKQVYFALSGLLAGLAILTKYTAVSIFFIFLLYNIIYKKSYKKAYLSFLIPLALVILWGLHGIYFYGRPHFFTLSEGVPFFWKCSDALREWLINFTGFLVFLSGCSLFVIFSIFGAIKESRKKVFMSSIAISTASSLITIYIITLFAKKRSAFDFILIFLFIVLSLYFLKNCFLYYFKNKNDKHFVFIFSWFLLNSFIVMFNYVIAARFLLLVLPPMGLLVAYLMEKGSLLKKMNKKFIYAGCVVIFLITLLIAHSDYCFARSGKVFSNTIRQSMPDKKIWFVGHWGFQYYMEKKNCKALDFNQASLEEGDVIIMPIPNTTRHPEILDKIAEHDRVYVNKDRGIFSIMHKAGFYYHRFGPLPYAPGAGLPEEYHIYKVKKPIKKKLL